MSRILNQIENHDRQAYMFSCDGTESQYYNTISDTVYNLSIILDLVFLVLSTAWQRSAPEWQVEHRPQHSSYCYEQIHAITSTVPVTFRA